MIAALFSRLSRRTATIEALYGAIVAQARAPVFYLEYGVADTVNGRFEMILMHAALLLDRLAGEEAGIRAVGQGVFDRFCQDMDDTLRERGISDVKVPKEMKRVAEAFYGRQAAYRAALADTDPSALAAALRRNLYAGAPDEGAAERMASYMRMAAEVLRKQEAAALADGRLAWPDPAAVSPPVRA
jgi:cytochrome b pre-mRNA-processing protein 3